MSMLTPRRVTVDLEILMGREKVAQGRLEFPEGVGRCLNQKPTITIVGVCIFSETTQYLKFKKNFPTTQKIGLNVYKWTLNYRQLRIYM